MNLFVLTVQYAFYYFLHTFLYIFLFQEDISEHFATFGEIDNINLKELQILLIAIHGGGGLGAGAGCFWILGAGAG